MTTTRIFALLMLAACGTTETPNPNFPPTTLPTALTTCAGDDDCSAFELGCCDDCNGGVRVAMRTDTTPEEVDTYRETCFEGQACTLIACEKPPAICDNGTCVIAPRSE